MPLSRNVNPSEKTGKFHAKFGKTAENGRGLRATPHRRGHEWPLERTRLFASFITRMNAMEARSEKIRTYE